MINLCHRNKNNEELGSNPCYIGIGVRRKKAGEAEKQNGKQQVWQKVFGVLIYLLLMLILLPGLYLLISRVIAAATLGQCHPDPRKTCFFPDSPSELPLILQQTPALNPQSALKAVRTSQKYSHFPL